ncbi:MAG: ATP-binding protein [Salinivirgaceae bacterium]|nr:ATP-binding protein [Salinivirgaceae bacterium]
MEQQLKNLPIGIQDFESLRNDNYLYVDKTALMYKLLSTGRYYFLSRPRRFGKSLLISTLKTYFLGKKELFKGLAVEQLEKEWAVHPVLHLDLNTAKYAQKGTLDKMLNNALVQWEKIYGAEESEADFGMRFEGVIRRAREITGQRVVILVDEYDKPMLETINNQELQDDYRSTLKAFYGALKSMDGCIKFALLTGVTKFGKVSVFSDLNNLNDISMDADYYNICGIDNEELNSALRPYVEQLAEKQKLTVDEAYAELQRRYDGYHFTEDTGGMYNPFSVLNTLAKKTFGNYWFETGTPSYLVELLKRHNYNLEQMANDEVDGDVLNSIDSTSTNPIPVIFQSGYLTIKGYDKEFKIYKLGFPNEEVKEGFLRYLLPYYVSVVDEGRANFHIMNFVREVRSGNIDAFMQRLKSFFADTPYELVRDLENHYQNVLYILCTLCGLYTKAEYHTAQGRIDMTIETVDNVYIFEFKFDKTADEALLQIKDNNYAEPFRASGKRLVLIGANFSNKLRNIENYVVENL